MEGENAHFHPAGIYLGGNEEALVRAIDADVVSLIALAQRSSGDGGENQPAAASCGYERPFSCFVHHRAGAGESGAVRRVTGGAKWRL